MEKFFITKSIVEESVCVAINQIVYVVVSETIKHFSTFLVHVIKISLICVNIQLEIKICQLDNTLSLSVCLWSYSSVIWQRLGCLGSCLFRFCYRCSICHHRKLHEKYLSLVGNCAILLKFQNKQQKLLSISRSISRSRSRSSRLRPSPCSSESPFTYTIRNDYRYILYMLCKYLYVYVCVCVFVCV